MNKILLAFATLCVPALLFFGTSSRSGMNLGLPQRFEWVRQQSPSWNDAAYIGTDTDTKQQFLVLRHSSGGFAIQPIGKAQPEAEIGK